MQGQPERQLEAVHAMFREILQARGFQYCDSEEGQPEQEAELLLEPSTAAEPLITAGLAASSTDHPSQSIARTLDGEPATFWSSSGAATPEEDAWLLYKLAAPLCAVQLVRIAFFRAGYQFGGPVYPPRSVSFQVGPNPTHFAPPIARYPVRATHLPQTFLLPASLPLGRYLRVDLHGRRQQQLEDMGWYLAVQSVEAFGHQLSPTEVSLLRTWCSGECPTLPAPGSLPAHLAGAAIQSLRPGGSARRAESEGRCSGGGKEEGAVGSQWPPPRSGQAAGGGSLAQRQAQEAAADGAAAAEGDEGEAEVAAELQAFRLLLGGLFVGDVIGGQGQRPGSEPGRSSEEVAEEEAEEGGEWGGWFGGGRN